MFEAGQDLETSLKQDFLDGTSILKIFQKRVQATDLSLKNGFFSAPQPVLPHRLCMVAIGSYGRVELQHASDLDLILLHEDMSYAELKALDASFLHPFIRRTGRKVAISNRPLADEVQNWQMSFQELTVSYETRRVFGNPDLFDLHRKKMAVYWSHTANLKTFYRNLQADYLQKQSVTAALGTTQSLKQSLRHYHFIYWASLYHPKKSFFDFVAGEQKQKFFAALEWIWTLREAASLSGIAPDTSLLIGEALEILATRLKKPVSREQVETMTESQGHFLKTCADAFFEGIAAEFL